MTYMLIRHKVKDYAKWKSAFDEHGATRKANGSKSAHLFRSANDPNEIIILFEWDELKNARQFTQSDDVKKVMERAGVVDRPDMYFLEEIEKAPA